MACNVYKGCTENYYIIYKCKLLTALCNASPFHHQVQMNTTAGQ